LNLAPLDRDRHSIAAMNVRLFLGALALCVGVGCESMSDATSGVRDRIAAREAPKTRTFKAEPRDTYEAVRIAATQMGYRFTRGGPAQGEFDGVNRVSAGENMGSARQLAIKVRLRAAIEGGTEVSVKITEILESDSSNRAGMATETPLRDTPQYEVFFQRVGDTLAKK
jgi:hypothetical protein